MNARTLGVIHQLNQDDDLWNQLTVLRDRMSAVGMNPDAISGALYMLLQHSFNERMDAQEPEPDRRMYTAPPV